MGRAPAPRIEGYEIGGCLGYGGMGTVWRATQVSTRRPVALKVMSERLFDSEKARQRFEREVELAARLDHPGIARVYDSGLSRGLYYYAMEFVDAQPLDEFVISRRLGQRPALELMARVCEAVQHAHSRGVIHRDLKPSNILVSGDGQPHVLDFGLAKGVWDASVSRAVSRDGEVAGTLAYMSPEQAAGRLDQVGTPSDVYSLGVMLYQSLLGRPPHDMKSSDLAMVRQIIEEEPQRPRQVDRAFNRELETLLLKALAHEPQRRYATAGDLGQDIRNFLEGEPLRARPPTIAYFLSKRIRRYRGRVTVAAVLAVLLVGMLVISWWRVAAERNRAQAAERLAQANAAESRQRLVAASVAQGMARLDHGDAAHALPWLSQALHADAGDAAHEWGDRLRLGAALRGVPRLERMWVLGAQGYRTEMLNAGALVMTVTAGGTGQFWDTHTGNAVGKAMDVGNSYRGCLVSRDGTRLLAWDAKTVQAFDVPTGQLSGPPLRHESEIHAMALAPDTAGVFTITENGVARVWDWSSGHVTASSTVAGQRFKRGHASPDGIRMTTWSWAAGEGAGPPWNVQTWDIRTAKVLHSLRVEQGFVEDAAEDANGHLAVATSTNRPGQTINVQHYDLSTGQPIGPAATMDALPQIGAGTWISPSGHYLHRTHGGTVDSVDLATLQRHTSASAEVVGHVYGHSSRDDHWMLITQDNGWAQLWDAGTGKPVTAPLQHESAVWDWRVSDDGKELFTLSREGVGRLWTTSTGKVEPAVPETDGRGLVAAFSASGKWALMYDEAGRARLWDTATSQALTPPLEDASTSQISCCILSPNEQFLASFTWDGQLVVRHLPDAKPVLTRTLGARHPYFGRFAPGDWELACATSSQVISIDVTTGAAAAPPISVDHADDLCFSPNGRRLLIVTKTQPGPPSVPGSWGIWEVATGRNVVAMAAAPRHIAVGFTDDGRGVVFMDHDANMHRFDAQTGAAVPPPWAADVALHGSSVRDVQVDHDLMIKPDFQAVRLWDVATGRPVTPPLAQDGKVMCTALSRDHRMIATGGEGGARIWEATTGLPLTAFMPAQGVVTWVGFNPAKPQLLSTAWGAARLVDLQPDQRPVETLVGLAELLGASRVGSVGTPEALTPEELKSLWAAYGDKQ